VIYINRILVELEVDRFPADETISFLALVELVQKSGAICGGLAIQVE
jgi:hypothetical protein